MNNYDKIKCMNQKELAKLLIELTEPCDTIKYCRNFPECIAMADSDGEIPKEKCVGCMVLWLEGEATLEKMKGEIK